jgi:uncharacterized membrane protein
MMTRPEAERKTMDGESLGGPSLTSRVANSPETRVTCPNCGKSIPSDAAFCPDCAWPLGPVSSSDRHLAALAYLTFIPAAIFLLLPDFRRRRFIRFHAWQSVTLWGVFLVLTIAAIFLSNIAAAIVFLLFGILATLAMVFLWFVLSIKAWQGERFELPLLGELAARLR